MPLTSSNPFKWRHYPGAVIICCARYDLRYPLAYAHVAELMRERGLAVDGSSGLAVPFRPMAQSWKGVAALT